MALTLQVNKGGIGPANPYAGPTAFATGQSSPQTTTSGTDTAPVVTETYLVDVFVPHNHISTGFQLLNGSLVAGNVTAILYDSNGAPITQSASTVQANAAALQLLPWATAQNLRGPAKYIIGLQFNNTGARFRTHILGAFGASKKTAETYGTATAVTPPTTHTTGLGPMGSTY